MALAAPIRATTVREWFPEKEQHQSVKALVSPAVLPPVPPAESRLPAGLPAPPYHWMFRPTTLEATPSATTYSRTSPRPARLFGIEMLIWSSPGYAATSPA